MNTHTASFSPPPEADIPTVSSLGELYPTPELSTETSDKRLDQLCASHGIPADSWDKVISQRGHLILQWVEPSLHLAVLVTLSASDFSIEIGRNRYTYGGGTRPVQRVTSTHAYNVPSAELRAVLGEIRVARAKGPRKKRAPGRVDLMPPNTHIASPF